MQECVWSGNARTERKMIDQFSAEERFGRKFLNLLVVFRMVRDRARFRLSKARCSGQEQRQQNTGEHSVHKAPQGNFDRGDYIASASRNFKRRHFAAGYDLGPSRSRGYRRSKKFGL